jgi:hypothetical protein
MMNTFQFISSIGGAGAPEGNKGNKEFRDSNAAKDFSLSSFSSV